MHAGGSRKNPRHPALLEVQGAIERDYRVRFDGFGLQYYRDARDSVAMHRDREMRWLDDTVVAILTLGATRPFLVQRRDSRDRASAFDLAPASGDLMVFGGRFQADWLHGVPKVRRAVRGRISVHGGTRRSAVGATRCRGITHQGSSRDEHCR
jgi:alkylated DNA repair dioxygenase AlkB